MNFQEFYDSAAKIAKAIKKDFINQPATTEIIDKYINQNLCIQIGILNSEIKNTLCSTSNYLTLSTSNLVKNQIKHPEIDFDIYKNTIYYINSSKNRIVAKDKIIFDILIEQNKHRFVIKTTRNKDENYLLSIHLANH